MLDETLNELRVSVVDELRVIGELTSSARVFLMPKALKLDVAERVLQDCADRLDGALGRLAQLRTLV